MEAAVLMEVRRAPGRLEGGSDGPNLLLEGLLVEGVAWFGQSWVQLGPQG